MNHQIPKNPFIESIFTADPSAHTWDGKKVYVYASHDMDPARGCDLMDRYHIFSSDDMVNWVDEGEILRSDNVKWGRPEGGFMWAPDCAYKNGTYYFYYPHPSETRWNDTWKIGVATSKHPHKDFTDQGYVPGLGGFALIDPCVFIDDDGTPYMYVGGGSRCQGGIMNDDMLTMKTEMADMVGLVDFHEATWVFKRNGVYYLTYSDNNHGNNNMRYAVSDSPLGPWEHKGIFLEPTGCETSHGSVMEFQGQWYLFYHNDKISGRGNLRSICVDKLYFNDDGTIQIVKQTADGIKSDKIPSGAITYAAETATLSGGASLTDKPGGGKAITNLSEKTAQCTFSNIDGKDGGRATIWVSFATAEALAKVNLTVNGSDWSLLNALSTGGEYCGLTRLTVPLNPGVSNSVTLSGGHGDLNIDAIVVSYFND